VSFKKVKYKRQNIKKERQKEKTKRKEKVREDPFTISEEKKEV
jgi:hypothetical protein